MMKIHIHILIPVLFGLIFSLSILAMEPDQAQVLLSGSGIERVSSTSKANNDQKQFYVCTYEDCAKILERRNLERHMISHRNKRNFICSICDSRFKHKYHLTNHEQCVHTEKREYLCKKCTSAFKTQKELNRHLRGVNCTSQEYLHRLVRRRLAMQSNLFHHFLLNGRHR